MMKDGLGGKIITKFVTSRAKTYMSRKKDNKTTSWKISAERIQSSV